MAIAILIFSTFSHAQILQVKGKITNLTTKLPIEGATVMIKKSKTGISSNSAENP